MKTNMEKKKDKFLTSEGCFDLIYACVQKTHLIHIVRWNAEKRNDLDLGLEIFDALKKQSMGPHGRLVPNSSESEIPKKTHKQLLKLALGMDRVDLAKRYILDQIAEDIHCIISKEVFFEALIGDKAEFIQLFLDCRFSMNYFIHGRDESNAKEAEFEAAKQLKEDMQKKVKELNEIHDYSQVFYEEKLDPLLKNLFPVKSALLREIVQVDAAIPIVTRESITPVREFEC